jgi:uncharacterized SAM-binding protein YcdF (DUF218 family)
MTGVRSDPAVTIQRRPPSRYRADAIVVLGRGVNADGSLPLTARARVERAVALYRGGIAPRLIASGRNSLMAEQPPPVTEAAAMARLARELGVPPEAILIEDQARDTIGNAYFTARGFLEPNGWDAIRVVTSDYHVPRTSWIFQKVLGSGVDVSFSPASSELFANSVAQRAREESDIARFLMEWLGDIGDGDRAAIDRFIGEAHPAYGVSPIMTAEGINNRVAEIARSHRDEDRKVRGHRIVQERLAGL